MDMAAAMAHTACSRCAAPTRFWSSRPKITARFTAWKTIAEKRGCIGNKARRFPSFVMDSFDPRTAARSCDVTSLFCSAISFSATEAPTWKHEDVASSTDCDNAPSATSRPTASSTARGEGGVGQGNCSTFSIPMSAILNRTESNGVLLIAIGGNCAK